MTRICEQINNIHYYYHFPVHLFYIYVDDAKAEIREEGRW